MILNESELKLIDQITNDIWNFHLALFGITLTLFTVVYSFILNKRDELRALSNEIKNGNTDPLINQRQTFAKEYISKFKMLNVHLIIITASSFLLFIPGWILERFVSKECQSLKLIMFYSISILTFILIAYFLVLFITILFRYKNSTKI